MTPIAIIMLVVAIFTVWGGLVASIVNLYRRPDLSAEETVPAEARHSE